MFHAAVYCLQVHVCGKEQISISVAITSFGEILEHISFLQDFRSHSIADVYQHSKQSSPTLPNSVGGSIMLLSNINYLAVNMVSHVSGYLIRH
jgi:hypothetical protein